MPHPDVPSEQDHLDEARTALAQMAARTERSLAATESGATEADSEVARWHLRRRLASLGIGDELAAFGRIDAGPDRWYVGRRHVEDTAGDPLVVDWRAPVSVPFYRATVHDPLGLDARRRYTGEGPTLVDILEEDFTDPDGAVLSGGIPDPLLAELDRERTGAMRDIVATIAAEQDEIIRTPLDRLLVVQGGPGTGKTAVALHRAAYLLFEHRLALLDTGVLVIGPNPVFLRYVSDVLPSLGETAVRQTTIEGLRPPGLRLGGPDLPGPGRVKGDGRMAAVIAAAIRSTIRLPAEAVAFSTSWGMVRLSPDDVSEAVHAVLARGVAHATGREALRNQLLHRAYDTHEGVAETPALKANFVAGARADQGFRRFVDRVWPMPSPTSIVQKLLGGATLRRRSAAGILEVAEADLLGRPVSRRVAEERWSPAEIALLDEAEAQLTGVRATYGHIVVDEAQDLSTMALRMLARRAATGSITVVGDLAQATQPWAQRSWIEVAATLAGGAAVEQRELTVGYRTPASILDLANRLLPSAAPEVTPARSIRSTGTEPRVVAAMPDEVIDRVVAEVRVLTGGRGTTAVVAPDALVPEVTDALSAAAIAWSTGADGDRAVTVVTPLGVKGLEFDHVVVVEPELIASAEEHGLRALFVSLTRPTRTLVIVHAHPLPAALR